LKLAYTLLVAFIILASLSAVELALGDAALSNLLAGVAVSMLAAGFAVYLVSQRVVVADPLVMLMIAGAIRVALGDGDLAGRVEEELGKVVERYGLVLRDDEEGRGRCLRVARLVSRAAHMLAARGRLDAASRRLLGVLDEVLEEGVNNV